MAKSRMWPNWTPASTSSTAQPPAALGFEVSPVTACSFPLAPAAVNDGRGFEGVAGADQAVRPHERDFRAVHGVVAVQPLPNAPGECAPLRLGHRAIPRVQTEADHVLAQRFVETDLDLEFCKRLEHVREV